MENSKKVRQVINKANRNECHDFSFLPTHINYMQNRMLTLGPSTPRLPSGPIEPVRPLSPLAPMPPLSPVGPSLPSRPFSPGGASEVRGESAPC